MRPVSITTATPDAYPQGTLLAAPINVFIPAQTQTTVAAAQAAQAALIDQWDANGRTIVGNSKVIYPNDADQNATANQQFTGYAEALQTVTGYRQARSSQIGAIGQYCSYCELPLTSSLAIEHTLPKYWFPQNQLSWSNFLLACPVCNSVKGSNPNQQVCTPPYTNSADAATQITGIYDAAPQTMGIYAWPNTYWQGYANYSQLPVTLQLSASPALPDGDPAPKRQRVTRSSPFVTPVSTASATPSVEAGLTSLDLGFAIIIDGQYLEATSGNRSPSNPGMNPVTAEIHANGDGNSATAINQTIKLVGLNSMTINNASASDLRVAYRSQTCARTQSMLMHFNALVSNQVLVNAVPNLAYSLLQLIIESAAASGFWTVWVYALRNINVTAPNGSIVSAQTMLQQAFTGTAGVTWTVGG